MEKSIKLIIAGLLCSSIAAAQVADSIQHYGRGISFSKKEATTAGGMATADELSHRTSTVASNALFGLIPGLQVLQNGGNEWGKRCYALCAWRRHYQWQKSVDSD